MDTPHRSGIVTGLAAAAALALAAACASRTARPGDTGHTVPADSARGATAVNRITRADIENARTSDIAVIIESKLPGVRVIARGSDYVVRIRGAASFMARTDALVLIDGMEGTLGSVSIHDIQTIEVLKDAAAAFYGVRGANGVLLITTRQP